MRLPDQSPPKQGLKLFLIPAVLSEDALLPDQSPPKQGLKLGLAHLFVAGASAS